MRAWLALLAAAVASPALAQVGGGGGAGDRGVPAIDGMGLLEARARLLAAGWSPAGNAERPAEDPDLQSGNGPWLTARGYREAVSCAGTGLGPCLLRYRDASGRSLAVVTLGEAPDLRVSSVQVEDEAEGASAAAGIVAEAEAFMAAYARELGAGDRAAIARRYDRRGAWRVGHGEKSFETWAAIAAYYAGDSWSPPASFAWRDLSYEPAGPDALVVVGLFDWGPGEGRAPVTLSYTGLLVRRDGALRIRLEDESAARR